MEVWVVSHSCVDYHGGYGGKSVSGYEVDDVFVTAEEVEVYVREKEEKFQNGRYEERLYQIDSFYIV